MRRLILLSILPLISFISKSQNVLYNTDFSSATGWSLGEANNFDAWIVNNTYNCSTPTPDAGGGKYLHIYNDLEGEYCAYAGFMGMGSSGTCYAAMSSGVNTTGQTEITISFDWLCKGQTGALPSFGFVEYSTNGGSTWTRITQPTKDYSNQTTWKRASISSNSYPDLLNKTDLRIRFGWTNSGYGSNPAFSIDNFKIEGGGVSCLNTGGTISPSQLEICENSSASFSLTGFVGNIQWQDSISGGSWQNLNSSSPLYTSPAISISHSYRAVLSQDACPDQYSTTALLTVNPLPQVSLILPEFWCQKNTQQTLSGGAPEGGTYSGIGVQDNKFDISQPAGDYQIYYTYTDNKGCIDSASSMVRIDLCTSVNSQNYNHEKIKVYPNPASNNNSVTIETTEEEAVVIKVLGLAGQQFKEFSVFSPGKTSLDGLAKGYYWIVISSEHGNNMIPLFIQ